MCYEVNATESRSVDGEQAVDVRHHWTGVGVTGLVRRRRLHDRLVCSERDHAEDGWVMLDEHVDGRHGRLARAWQGDPWHLV